jgi:hypothetical protein
MSLDKELIRNIQRSAGGRLLSETAHQVATPFQNIPLGFAAGMLGAYQLAALAGVPTTCKTSQCSIAFPSLSIL